MLSAFNLALQYVLSLSDLCFLYLKMELCYLFSERNINNVTFSHSRFLQEVLLMGRRSDVKKGKLMNLFFEYLRDSNRSDRQIAKVLGVSQPTVSRMKE